MQEDVGCHVDIRSEEEAFVCCKVVVNGEACLSDDIGQHSRLRTRFKSHKNLEELYTNNTLPYVTETLRYPKVSEKLLLYRLQESVSSNAVTCGIEK